MDAFQSLDELLHQASGAPLFSHAPLPLRRFILIRSYTIGFRLAFLFRKLLYVHDPRLQDPQAEVRSFGYRAPLT